MTRQSPIDSRTENRNYHSDHRVRAREQELSRLPSVLIPGIRVVGVKCDEEIFLPYKLWLTERNWK